jgi:hypothetical protein
MKNPIDEKPINLARGKTAPKTLGLEPRPTSSMTLVNRWPSLSVMTPGADEGPDYSTGYCIERF